MVLKSPFKKLLKFSCYVSENLKIYYLCIAYIVRYRIKG